ncbi:LON peptidase substrate-binding domain-containing protein [Phaeovulum vinaykumarii]|uniref:Lon N-terminal domain-containing protein n=1 Tax=Phaeovulum vinaykumarii TaxID=407234 RepID=A0A1N7KQ91_9RHOB|nr:LON peptidase substrate-binding domain-containing protein [Phaeovulum vinaykumarii]SIS63666.1 hypothetical protein SAMN05421795_10234 [Phaeovulum vinaykumarii]SOC01843.1 hypothetical protein SAMN05878426_102740 [Phaeovulum vinaykumarii]
MTKSIELPRLLPLFPLPGALLLPRGRLPLHIFEPRYLHMLDDCLKTPARLIGMIQPRRLPGGESVLNTIGCAGRITAFSETEDGRYMITLTGVSRFRLMSEAASDTPYRQAEISWEGFGRDRDPRPETDDGFERDPFMDLLCRYFAAQGLSTDWESLREADDEFMLNSLSMLLPFEPEDKQALLEAPSLSTRRETLVTLLEFALRGGEGEMVQ